MRIKPLLLAAATLLAAGTAHDATADEQYLQLTLRLGSSEYVKVNLTLFTDAAPNTVANFLKYVDADYTKNPGYLGSVFHRSVPGFVVQGGGQKLVNGELVDIGDYGTVVNEFGISNTRGTLAMAKVAQYYYAYAKDENGNYILDGNGEKTLTWSEDNSATSEYVLDDQGDKVPVPGTGPDSATSEWFVNMDDNSANLDNANGGFTVFGEVGSDASMGVFDYINSLTYWDDMPIIQEPSGYYDENNQSIYYKYPITIVGIEKLDALPVVDENTLTWRLLSGTWGGSGDFWSYGDGLHQFVNDKITIFPTYYDSYYNQAYTSNITIAENVSVAELRINGHGEITFTGNSHTVTGAVNPAIADSTGALTKNGYGLATFKNTKLDFEGGVKLNEGRLSIEDSTVTADFVIAENPDHNIRTTALRFLNTVVTGDISAGTGTLVSFKGETTVFTGTFTGTVQNSAVQLSDNATLNLASGFTNSGNLNGTGTLNINGTFQNNGTLAPGGSDIGTLTINATDYVFAESGKFELQIDKDGNHDKIVNASAANITAKGAIVLSISREFLDKLQGEKVIQLADFLESGAGGGQIAFDSALLATEDVNMIYGEYAVDEIAEGSINLLYSGYVITGIDETTGAVSLRRAAIEIEGLRPDLTGEFLPLLNEISKIDGGVLDTVFNVNNGGNAEAVRLSPLGFGALTALPITQSANATGSLLQHLKGLRSVKAPRKPYLEPGFVERTRETAWGTVTERVKVEAAAPEAAPAPEPESFGNALYFTTTGNFASNRVSAESPVFDANTMGATIGADHALNEAYTIGAAFGANTAKATLHHGGGKVEQDQFRLSAYGEWQPRDNFWVDGVLHAGFSNYDTTRNNALTGTGSNTADTSGYDFGAAVYAGGIIPFNGIPRLFLSPFAGFEYVHAEVDGFSEGGPAGALPLVVDSFSQDSLRARFGASIDWHAREWLKLSFMLSYAHELLDNETDIAAWFPDYASLGKFTTTTPATAEKVIELGPSVEVMLSPAAQVRFDYTFITDTGDQSAHRVNASFVWKF